MSIHFFDSEDWALVKDDISLKIELKKAAEKHVKEASEILNFDSKNLNIVIRPWTADGLINSTADNAYTHDSEFIEYKFDPKLPYGKEKLLQSFKDSIFHEINHAYRFSLRIWHEGLLESAVFEGLATVFEREYAGAEPLWGKYEDDKTMAGWLEELKVAKRDWSKRQELFFENPDGRNWIAYKTGTWIIDKAVKSSEKSVVELTRLTNKEILNLAKPA